MKHGDKYYFSDWDIIYLLAMAPRDENDEGAKRFRLCMSCITDGMATLENGNKSRYRFAKDALYTTASLLPSFNRDGFRRFIESFLSISLDQDEFKDDPFWQQFLNSPLDLEEFKKTSFWMTVLISNR